MFVPSGGGADDLQQVAGANAKMNNQFVYKAHFAEGLLSPAALPKTYGGTWSTAFIPSLISDFLRRLSLSRIPAL